MYVCYMLFNKYSILNTCKGEGRDMDVHVYVGSVLNNSSSIQGAWGHFLAVPTIFNKILQLVVKINIFQINQ